MFNREACIIDAVTPDARNSAAADEILI